MLDKYFTSEYVTPGHPDKVADIISDSLLDLCLKQNSNSRVAIETLVARENVIVAGEYTAELSDSEIDNCIIDVVDNLIGYNYDDMKFSTKNLKISNLLVPQSKDISDIVTFNDSEFIGAGDQGIMFGGATNRYDKVSYMPIEWRISNDLAKQLFILHKKYPEYIRPDGKTQVTCYYDLEDNTMKIDTIVVSFQHSNVSEDKYIDIKEIVVKECIMEVLTTKYFWIDYKSANLLVNACGQFVIGGPDGDTGLTGRKIVVDGYGGYFPVGGGAFSGKDASKVDRSGALMARNIAVSIVESGIASDCLVQLSYGIGRAQPISVNIKLDNVAKNRWLTEDCYKNWLKKFNYSIINNIDMTPAGIIKKFSLRDPNIISYQDLAMNGHFGRPELPWEKPDNDIIDMLYKV